MLGDAWESVSKIVDQKSSIMGLGGGSATIGPSRLVLTQRPRCLDQFFCVIAYSCLLSFLLFVGIGTAFA